MTDRTRLTDLALDLHAAIVAVDTRGCTGTHIMGRGYCQELAANLAPDWDRDTSALLQRVAELEAERERLRAAIQVAIDAEDGSVQDFDERHPDLAGDEHWSERLLAHLRAALVSDTAGETP